MTEDDCPPVTPAVPAPTVPMSPGATPEAQAMAAAAAAVSGPGTPESAHVTAKPDDRLVLALMLAGPAISAMVVAAQLAQVFVFWPAAVAMKSIPVMTDIVRGNGLLACGLAALLGIVVFRLASGGLKKVEAKAGPAGINIETGG